MRCSMVYFKNCCLGILSLMPWMSGTIRAEAPRPNIVVILADDMGYADVGFNGGQQIATPHLDSLAERGTVLTSFYVQPVCSPTRGALMTGRYPMRYGLQVGVIHPQSRFGLPLDERMLPEVLQQAGYRTAICGKWHLGCIEPEYRPERRGFAHAYGHMQGMIDYFTHVRDGKLDWFRNGELLEEPGYTTHLIGADAVRFLEEQEAGQPFFLYVPFNAVHSPFQVPEEYLSPYAALPAPRQAYAGMLAALDEAVGKIIATLDRRGLSSETLIFFSSDNGGPSPGRVTDNTPLRGGKATLYEGGVRVAACATWPGKIPAGVRNDTPLHIVDWFPTLLRLAGADPSSGPPLDGLDLWEALTSGGAAPHEEILLNATPADGALRQGDWKLVLHGLNAEPGSDIEPQVELFNLREDVAESRNVAADHPDLVQRLRERFDEYAAAAVPPKYRLPWPPGNARRPQGQRRSAPARAN